MTYRLKSDATAVPPLSLVTAFLTSSVPVWRLLLKVHVVVSSDSAAMSLIVLPLRVPVEAPPCLVQLALSSSQPRERRQ